MMNTKESAGCQGKTVAIIPAAGAGTRMGSHRAKQFLELAGRPLLALTLQVFQDCPSVDAVIVVAPSGEVDNCRKEIVERFQLEKVRDVVAGGERRQDSVRIGLAAASAGYDLAVIHDGVRPLIEPAFLDRLVAVARKHRAVITGMPAKETVKAVNARQEVVETYDRHRIWLVQTPQIFRYGDILLAHQRALQEGWESTDDSSLLERLGIRVKVLEGTQENIKITTPHDLALARFLLGKESLSTLP